MGPLGNSAQSRSNRVIPRNEESRLGASTVAETEILSASPQDDTVAATLKLDITVIARDEVEPIPLPNGSWSRMVLTRETAPGIASSLGYSVFTPGTATGMVSHEVEEVAYVLTGRGELRTDGDPVPFAAGQALRIPPGLWHAVANTGDQDVAMVFGFPHPDYPPTERR